MNRMRCTLRSAVSLPLLPCHFKSEVRLLRLLRWLPRQPKPGDAIRRILVVQPHNSLGDLVLCLPLLDEIHRLWPDSRIDLLVGRRMTSLYSEIPYIDRVIGFLSYPGQGVYARYRNTLGLLQLFRHDIRDGYDLALDPRWDSDGYAYLARAAAYLSGAAIRASYSGWVDRIDPSLDDLMTHHALGGGQEHESVRKLRLLYRAGLSAQIPPEEAAAQANATLVELAQFSTPSREALLQRAGIQAGERYAVLAPSASSPIRIWPIEGLAEIAQTLHKRYGLRFVTIGTAAEAARSHRLAALQPAIIHSLAGETSLLELLSLLAGAELFLGNDSGPAHVSGMLGQRTVVVFSFPASSNGLDHIYSPRRFGPCGSRVRVLQPERALAPCDPSCMQQQAHCITQVTPETVLQACVALLSDESRSHEQLQVNAGRMA